MSTSNKRFKSTTNTTPQFVMVSPQTIKESRRQLARSTPPNSISPPQEYIYTTTAVAQSPYQQQEQQQPPSQLTGPKIFTTSCLVTNQAAEHNQRVLSTATELKMIKMSMMSGHSTHAKPAHTTLPSPSQYSASISPSPSRSPSSAAHLAQPAARPSASYPNYYGHQGAPHYAPAAQPPPPPPPPVTAAATSPYAIPIAPRRHPSHPPPAQQSHHAMHAATVCTGPCCQPGSRVPPAEHAYVGRPHSGYPEAAPFPPPPSSAAAYTYPPPPPPPHHVGQLHTAPNAHPSATGHRRVLSDAVLQSSRATGPVERSSNLPTAYATLHSHDGRAVVPQTPPPRVPTTPAAFPAATSAQHWLASQYRAAPPPPSPLHAGTAPLAVSSRHSDSPPTIATPAMLGPQRAASTPDRPQQLMHRYNHQFQAYQSPSHAIPMTMQQQTQVFSLALDHTGKDASTDDSHGLGAGNASVRRAAQNRAAQRAFRLRKERYMKDLEFKARVLAHAQRRLIERRDQVKQLRRLARQLQRENAQLRSGGTSTVAASIAEQPSHDSPMEVSEQADDKQRVVSDQSQIDNTGALPGSALEALLADESPDMDEELIHPPMHLSMGAERDMVRSFQSALQAESGSSSMHASRYNIATLEAAIASVDAIGPLDKASTLSPGAQQSTQSPEHY